MDIQKLFNDEEFVRGLLDKETAEEAQAYFEANGVTLTLTEVREIADTLKKVASGEISEETLEKAAKGELTEEELADVAGGFAITITGVIVLAAIGSSIGTSVGILSVVCKWRW